LTRLSCPLEDYSAFDLLAELGSDHAISAERYSAEKGAFEWAGFGPEGQIVGVDFPIVPGEGYLVAMKQTLESLNPRPLSLK
jgi:hypothetical protein